MVGIRENQRFQLRSMESKISFFHKSVKNDALKAEKLLIHFFGQI